MFFFFGRVLRPSAASDKVITSGGDAPPAVEVNISEEMTLGEHGSIEEVNQAYEHIKEVEGLDITKEGNEMWEAAIKRYEDRIDRVEVSSRHTTVIYPL